MSHQLLIPVAPETRENNRAEIPRPSTAIKAVESGRSLVPISTEPDTLLQSQAWVSMLDTFGAFLFGRL